MKPQLHISMVNKNEMKGLTMENVLGETRRAIVSDQAIKALLEAPEPMTKRIKDCRVAVFGIESTILEKSRQLKDARAKIEQEKQGALFEATIAEEGGKKKYTNESMRESAAAQILKESAPYFDLCASEKAMQSEVDALNGRLAIHKADLDEAIQLFQAMLANTNLVAALLYEFNQRYATGSAISEIGKSMGCTLDLLERISKEYKGV